jgi:hypothetical protein
MSIYWRPLEQEEIAELAAGQPVVIRQNYLYNPERRPVTYIEATFVQKVKRAVIRVLQDGTSICVGLSEVGLWEDNGWHSTADERGILRSGSPVLVYRDSGEIRPAQFVSGAQNFGAKVIYAGETEISLVAARSIGLHKSK